jgi:hypothetical protein
MRFPTAYLLQPKGRLQIIQNRILFLNAFVRRQNKPYISNLRRITVRSQYELSSRAALPTGLDGERLKYIALICRLLGDTVYLVYILVLWLCLRIYRRLRSQARQQLLICEAKAEGELRDAIRKTRDSALHIDSPGY